MRVLVVVVDFLRFLHRLPAWPFHDVGNARLTPRSPPLRPNKNRSTREGTVFDRSRVDRVAPNWRAVLLSSRITTGIVLFSGSISHKLFSIFDLRFLSIWVLGRVRVSLHAQLSLSRCLRIFQLYKKHTELRVLCWVEFVRGLACILPGLRSWVMRALRSIPCSSPSLLLSTVGRGCERIALEQVLMQERGISWLWLGRVFSL